MTITTAVFATTVSNKFSTSTNKIDIALELLKDKQVETYMNNTLRRLKNFERLLNLKMDKFNVITSVNAKPRLVFLMTYEELVKMYVDRQKKKQSMKHVTSGFKLTATIALLKLCLYLVYSLFSFKRILEQIYTKRKAAKEKRKRWAKKKKRRQVLSKL